MQAPSLSVLQGERTYKRQPPSVYNVCSPNHPDILAYFYAKIAETEARVPAEGFYEIKDCYIYEGSYILTSDLKWVDISVIDLNDKEKYLENLRPVILGGYHPPLHPTDSGRVTVVIAKAGYSNYGHFLTDIAPKIINVKKSGLKDIDILIPFGMQKFKPIVASLVEGLGISAKLVDLPPAALHFVDRLLFFGPVSKHNTLKSLTLLELRDVLYSIHGAAPIPKRRLFVARRPAEQRAIVNAAEVEEVMQRLGYEAFYPAEHSFADQLSIFSEASHIVGALGAGMVNGLFASRFARVALLDPGIFDFYFWDLSNLIGQEFRWIFTSSLEHYSHEKASAAFAVDPMMLEYCIRDL